jgi:hypothetical protein
MSDPIHTTVRVDVPEVDNVIEIGELLRGLRDFAAQRAAPPRRPSTTLRRDRDDARLAELDRVSDLAAQLADLVDRIPDLPGPRRRPPS